MIIGHGFPQCKCIFFTAISTLTLFSSGETSAPPDGGLNYNTDNDVDSNSEDGSDSVDERNKVPDKEDSGSDNMSNGNKEGDIVIVNGQNNPANMVLQMPTISMDDVMMPLTDPTLHENVGSYQ